MTSGEISAGTTSKSGLLPDTYSSDYMLEITE
jgi:hypothetical protein